MLLNKKEQTATETRSNMGESLNEVYSSEKEGESKGYLLCCFIYDDTEKAEKTMETEIRLVASKGIRRGPTAKSQDGAKGQ